MINLDENIGEDQIRQLRRWRIHFQQIGQTIGRQGMKDMEHVLPLLHQLDRPTFFTRDLDFFDRELCHAGYGIVCLAVPRKDAAAFTRTVLHHPSCRTKAKRMGTVIRAGQIGMLVWRLDIPQAEEIAWIG